MFWYKIIGKTFQVYYGPGVSDNWYTKNGYQHYPGNENESALQVAQDGLSLELKPVVPPVRIFSKIDIRRSLRQLGESWELLLDTLLDSDPKYRKDWTDSTEIREDDPMFVSFIQQISQLPEASGIDLNEILSQSSTRAE